MKIGIKEFRERIGEIADGNVVVELMRRGKIVGEYRPRRTFDHAAAHRAAESVRLWQEEMRAKGVEPEDWLAEIGLDPWGVPLEDRD